MLARVALRQITSSAVDFLSLSHSASDQFESSPDRHAIALVAPEFKGHPRTPRDSGGAKRPRVAHQVFPHQVHLPVLKQVSQCESAGHTGFQYCRPRLLAGIAKGAVPLIELHPLRLTA